MTFVLSVLGCQLLVRCVWDECCLTFTSSYHFTAQNICCILYCVWITCMYVILYCHIIPIMVAEKRMVYLYYTKGNRGQREGIRRAYHRASPLH